MKKFNLLVALLLVVSLASVFAQDEEAAAPTLAGLHGATGEVTFSFGDSDLSDEAGFGFSSSASGSTTADVTAMVATDAVEAGVTISLVPDITLNENDSSLAESDNDLDFDLAQDVIDWYDDASGDNYDELQAVDWQAVINNTDLYTDADGFTADNISTAAEWDAAETDTDLVFTTAIAGIDALDAEAIGITYADVTANGAWYVDQFDAIRDGNDAVQVTDATAAEIDSMEAVNEATADYNGLFGSNDADTWTASYPVSNAYLRLKALFGVADVTFEVNGKAIAVGSKFTAAAEDANLGLTTELTDGVVEGVSAGLTYTKATSTNETLEDDQTSNVDAAAGDATVDGLKVFGGYATDMYNANVELGIADLANATVWYSVMGGVSLADLAGLSVDVELTGDGDGIGVAAAVGASVMGISPSVDFRTRSGYTDDADEKTDGTALEYFNTVDADNSYLGLGVSVDFAELIGMNLVTLSGSYNMVLTEVNDYSVAANFTFADFGAPVTFGASVASAVHGLNYKVSAGATLEGVALGAYFGTETDSDDAAGTVYGVTLDYTYDVLSVAASFTNDADQTQAVDVTVGTSF